MAMYGLHETFGVAGANDTAELGSGEPGAWPPLWDSLWRIPVSLVVLGAAAVALIALLAGIGVGVTAMADRYEAWVDRRWPASGGVSR